MNNISSGNLSEIPKIKLFCQISSIRGISKINSAKTKFEKFLWAGFVLMMTCILIVSMVFLIQSYLQYTTAWHTSTVLDFSSPFPAITICGQNPFSLAANELWLKRKIMSPSELQDNLTVMSLKAFDIPGLEGLAFLRLYDLFNTFYMNLPLSDTVELGHSKDMIRYCILIYKNDIVIAEKCDLSKEKFTIQLFSHQEYFNCYTIEGNEQNTTEILGLILLVQLIPSEAISELENSFLIDILQRGEGLKVTVHEPQTFPDIENSGINMHPSKMNSLIYSPTEWVRLSTPKNPCRANQRPFFDLHRKFNYTFTQCVLSEMQREIIEKCGCMLSNIPRPYPLTLSVPYCLKLVPPDKGKIILDRLDCVEGIKKQNIKIRKRVQNNQCFLRCQFTTYDTTMSITQWNANEKKLKNLENLYRSYFAYRDDQSVKNVERIKEILNKSLNRSKELRDDKNGERIKYLMNEKNLDKNGFTYISLMRRNFDIQMKTEKLILDSNTLLSRIGGLTSICIGLTAAVFAEFVEFLYWVYILSFQKRSKQTLELNNLKKEMYFDSKQLMGFALQENLYDLEKSSDENNIFIKRNASLEYQYHLTDINKEFKQMNSLPNESTRRTINNQGIWGFT